MISSLVLKAMKAAGCSTDQIIAAVEADELASGDKAMARREADRIRKRRQRERESSTETVVASAMSRVTPVTERDTPSPPPAPLPKEIPQTPLEITLFPEPPPQPRVSGAREFERFWQLFPNKVGKADASKAFDKAIKRVDIENMVAGLDRYVHKTDDRPWCNPATWLNQDRWADQPATQAPRRAGPQRAPSALEVRSARLREKIENEYGFGRQGSGDPQDAGVLRLAGGTDVGRRN